MATRTSSICAATDLQKPGGKGTDSQGVSGRDSFFFFLKKNVLAEKCIKSYHTASSMTHLGRWTVLK